MVHFLYYLSYLKKSIVVLIFLSITSILTSQEKELDSLKVVLKKVESNNQLEKNTPEYVNLLNSVAKQYIYINLDSINFYAQKSYTLSKKINYNSGEIDALLNLANYNFYNGKSSKSLELLNTALILAKKSNDTERHVRILNIIALQQSDLGDYSASLKNYLKAITLAERINNIELIALLKENVALLYFKQKDYVMSLEFHKEVEKLNKILDDEVFMSKVNSNIAEVYLKLNDLKNAIIYIDGCISVFEKHDNLDWLAYSYHIKGQVFFKQKNYNKSLYWYNKSIDIHNTINDERYKATLLNDISESYLNLENYTDAEKNAYASLQISNKLQLLDDAIKAYSLLYQINKENNLPAKALRYHESYKSLSDSITRIENLNSLEVLKTKKEFEKKQEYLILENQKKESQQNVFLVISIIVLSTLGLLIFLLVKQSKTRKVFNKELQLKTIALEKREQELNRINTTKDKLFSIIGHDLRGPINALSSMLGLVKNQEIKPEDFFNFTPKLKKDVDAISFTLNNLLSWGRSQMSGVVTSPTFINLFEIINNNEKFLRELAYTKSIHIKNFVSEESIVWADKNQIDLVVRNILSNAIKFSNEKGIITISSKENSNYIQIVITDNGVGISDEIKAGLFSFDNILITTYGTANEKGTGLGLPLCKEMIENNHGKIWVESKVGEGSSFFFNLPINKANI